MTPAQCRTCARSSMTSTSPSSSTNENGGRSSSTTIATRGSRSSVRPFTVSLPVLNRTEPSSSGENLPVMAGLEGALLDAAVAAGRPRTYVQIPTAASLEGDERLDWWVDLGVAQAERLGAEPVPVRVVDRATADDPALAALVDGAGLVYLSGGNPGHLARTLD